jgi:proteasome lid subunit RPN8/RPN11
MLLIPCDLSQRLRAHVESTYPEEGCGLLLGKFTETDGIAIALLETENAYPGDRKKHFEIAPEVMLQAQKSARERDLEIIGVYHSHPEHPAIPSAIDRQLAWPQYFYLIVAVDSGKAIDLRAWRLDDDGNFPEEAFESIDHG